MVSFAAAAMAGTRQAVGHGSGKGQSYTPDSEGDISNEPISAADTKRSAGKNCAPWRSKVLSI